MSLKLPEDLLAELEREAKARRVTKRRPVRGRANSCYDLARDLAGSVRGLPRGVVHNPEYMDGFGE